MRMILTATIAALLPLGAAAQDDPVAQHVKARQGYLQMLSVNMDTLSGMVRGTIDYDEDAATTAATNIETLTGYDFPALFIEGSAQGEAENSAARPDIWSDPEGFASKFSGLQEAAAGAGEAVQGGAENIGPVIQQLGGACKACHDDYRARS